tara:strand:+ start:432 stop:779 length:348 start_codon:yes stop_codon:yes gene_type:complete
MGKKEDKITVSMAGKSKKVTANQKRMAANAWRDSKDASSRARLRERFKKQGYSAADIKSIIAAAKSGPRAPVRSASAARQNTGLRKTFSTSGKPGSSYGGKRATSSPRRAKSRIK